VAGLRVLRKVALKKDLNAGDARKGKEEDIMGGKFGDYHLKKKRI